MMEVEANLTYLGVGREVIIIVIVGVGRGCH
jgi:hypothetical protein